MILVSAKNDSLLHPSSALQIFGNLSCDFVCSIFNDDIVIEITVSINAIFDYITELIALSITRPPPFRNVGLNIDDFERREKAVFDSFTQTIRINRLSEIIDIGNVLGFLRCRRHADLSG